MKINTVHIHNYRSVQDATISFRDYSIIVGENNVGKSNIIDAIRCFYGDIRFAEDDFCKRCNRGDRDAWIEIEYDLTDKEFSQLPQKYKLDTKKLRVRKDLTGDAAFHGYTKDGLETTAFCGMRGEKPTRLGNIIYVPAVVDVQESIKMSGTSVLGNLINLICQNPRFQREYKDKIEPVLSQVNKSALPQFKKLGKEINDEVRSSGVYVNIGARKFSAAEILKFLLNINVDDGVGGLSLDKIGTGLQRRIIAALIKINGQYAEREEHYKIKKRKFADATDTLVTGKSIRFLPKMTTLLFEEPEVSLHPTGITDLANDLRIFATGQNQQVIATTHSSQLVSEDIIDTKGIIRVERLNARTVVHQNKIPDADLELAKNMVYFDRPRSDLFFARKVILVEGPTEYMLYNYLKKRGDLPRQLTENVTLIDCVGKWSMPYFLKVLNTYNIRHAVLYDLDSDPNRQDNKDVQNEFSTLTDYSYGFPKDIETFCGIKKSGNPAINIIKKFEDGTVSPTQQAAVVQVFKDLITKHK